MYNKTKHQDKRVFCLICLQFFCSKEILTNHRELCLEMNGKQGTKIPEKVAYVN